MLKKFKLLLPMLVLFGAMPIAFAQADGFEDVDYNDPSQVAIEYLREGGVVQGYPDGEFKSLNKINRAEFLKIVVGSLEDFDSDIENSENCFSDIKDEWFAKYICYAEANDIVSGYSDGTFRPAENINFAEASKIVINAFDFDESDIDSNDPWYKAFVEPLAKKSAIPESISDLDKKIARGEMAEVIYRLKEEDKDRESLSYEDLEALPGRGRSCASVKEFFEKSRQRGRYDYFDMEEVVGAPVPVADAAPTTEFTTTQERVSTTARQSEGTSDNGSADFSTTNIQVAGVDEADIVKNDGKYIYMVKARTVRIIEAYPAENMKEIATITLDENASPDEMYVDGDRLIIVSNEYYNGYYDDPTALDYWVSNFHNQRTRVYNYNISDRTNPRVARKLTFDGYSIDSRKVDDTLYLILNQNLYYYNGDEEVAGQDLLPRFNDSLDPNEEQFLAGCGDLYFLPRARNMNKMIALAVPLQNNDPVVSEVMIGNSQNIYSSRDNLYVAATNYENRYGYYHDYNNEKTVVYRFELKPGSIEYKERGKVPGTILNQFSMDESKDHFRIATTKGNLWSKDPPSKNNLYVLNMDMDIVGSIEDIAPGEKIYSTRFMGDRGYMVTFKKVDPLFAFDLSDPENPKILGKLKIPGFSDYLHPYDENHIIGFGKDAVDASEDEVGGRNRDFAWYQGMKIALFDVSDPENPKQKFVELIGDRGTTSELLNDHKALLFDKSKNLLAFPVRVAEVPEEEKDRANAYGTTVFDGAYVYTLDLEDGFQLRGKISHYDKDDEAFLKQGDYWYGDYQKKIRRILYIGQNLYSVSQGFVKASDINTIKEKNFLELEPTFDYDDQIYEEDGISIPFIR